MSNCVTPHGASLNRKRCANTTAVCRYPLLLAASVCRFSKSTAEGCVVRCALFALTQCVRAHRSARPEDRHDSASRSVSARRWSPSDARRRRRRHQSMSPRIELAAADAILACHLRRCRTRRKALRRDRLFLLNGPAPTPQSLPLRRRGRAVRRGPPRAAGTVRPHLPPLTNLVHCPGFCPYYGHPP